MLKAAYMLLLLSGNGVSLIWKAIMIRSNLRPYIFYTWLKVRWYEIIYFYLFEVNTLPHIFDAESSNRNSPAVI